MTKTKEEDTKLRMDEAGKMISEGLHGVFSADCPQFDSLVETFTGERCFIRGNAQRRNPLRMISFDVLAKAQIGKPPHLDRGNGRKQAAI